MGKRKRQAMEEEDSSGVVEQDVLKSLKDRTDVCQRLLNAVKRVKGKSGHPKYEFLCRLPSRRSNPDYYRVISEPISLSDIEQKLKTRVYCTVSLFVTDMVQMFNNAEVFYEEGSQESDDARALHEEFSSELRHIVREEDATLSPENKKLKLKISGGKIVSSGSDMESGSDTIKNKRRKHRSISPSPSKHAEGEGLIVQIKLPEQSESPASSETWKPKREKQRKDYAELFGQRKMKKISEEEKEIMWAIYNKIINEKDDDGEVMCEPFMVKPSAKKYPHYYVLIKKPIDLQDIKEKIDNERYVSVERFMADVSTLFRNAKFFNEETSTIYKHADLLFKAAKGVLQQLTAQLQPAETSATPSPAPLTSEPASVKKDTPIDPNVGALFDEIKMFTDSDGRALWQTFSVVPNKLVNINYHNMIKQPMDMVTIAAKLLDREYNDVESIFNDFALMFDNTCRYYKSDTTQYKDAVTLHKVLLRKREQLTKNRPCVPHVIKLVQEILMHLVKVVMYYKDPTSGRRLSISVWLVAPSTDGKDEGENSVASVVDLLTIERRVAKGQYLRLDWLQDDIMSLLRHVQSTSTAGDQVYRDAVRLQQVYLQERDRLCAHGKLLWSPALSQYSLKELLQEEAWLFNMDDIIAVDMISQCLEECTVENDDDGLSSDCQIYLENVNFSGHTYSIGDFIYVTPKLTHMGGGCLPHIVAVEKLWMTNSGDYWCSGRWFYRPEQTFHTPTKKFSKYEVFHTDCQQMILLDRAVGKCCVLQYNDYCRNTVEGFNEEHIFVCREHYNVEGISFKPLENWGDIGGQWKLLPREQPLNLEFEYSKFVPQELITKLEASVATQRNKTAVAVSDNNRDNEETVSSGLVEFHVEYDNVESKDQSGVMPGCHSYDQYCLDQYCFRLGDYVYLRSDEQQSFIARIERMWTDENGDPWFHGCWFLRPSETVHPPTHLFYPNELLMSNIADTNPMRSVIGKCAVLPFKDYCTWRPTELEEKDVYLCEERYNEHDKDFKKLKGLKKYILSPDVVPDEVYYFPEEVTAYKEGSPSLLAELPSSEPAATVDVPPKTSTVANIPLSSSSIATTDHNNTEQQPAAAGVGVQPVMLFALDLQSQLRNRGVQLAFTTVVEVAKNEWSKLSTEQQEDYQLRSTELLSVMPKVSVAADQPMSQPAKPATPPLNATPRSCYVCHWEGCGLQFADVAGLFAHVTDLGPGSHIIKEGASEYYCEWRNCHRHKKSAGKRPFDTHTKLLRHLKEVHMSRAIKDKISTPQLQQVETARPVTPIENMHTPTTQFLPHAFQATPFSFTPAPVTMETNTTTAADTVTTNTINSIPSISAHHQEDSSKVKEKPQILHTTVYTRYLQGLRSNKQHFSNWHDSQTVQQCGMAQAPASLQPAKWISPKAIPNNKNITDALYQLRDHLLQDSAKLSKYLSSH